MDAEWICTGEGYNQCIADKSLICDGKNDCYYGYDETGKFVCGEN